MTKVRLYCLPHAGAIANVYKSWKKYMHNSIEICPIEMPGRGKRINAPFYESIEAAADDVFKMIQEDIKHMPYAILGHSMGSMIGYELCHKLNQSNCIPPIHVFFSGRKAPHIPENNRKIHNLPDEEFINEIIKLGGTSLEVFRHEELKNFFLPILRMDYRICEIYDYVDKGQLNFDLSILYGKEDDMTAAEVIQWKQHTKKSCNIYEFSGGHFFINNLTENVVEIINRNLSDSN